MARGRRPGTFLLIAAFIASCAGPVVSPSPSATPSPTPSAPATAASPTPAPTSTPGDTATRQAVGAGTDSTCQVRPDGSLGCWGWGQVGIPSGTFTAVSPTQGGGCAIRSDGTLACWQSDDTPLAPPPTGRFVQVSVGANISCGIRDDATLACWTDFADEPVVSPRGAFRDVHVTNEADSSMACGVRTDGTALCWDGTGRRLPGPKGTFVAVGTGAYHACAIQDDGRLACWGAKDPEGEHADPRTPPAGTFTSLSAGAWHTCAVRATDGSISCWGDDGFGQASPPAGRFTAVTAGQLHSCGVRADGGLVCWGYDSGGEVALEPGAMRIASNAAIEARAVYVGELGTCIIKPDATLGCWGSEFAVDSSTTPPPGRYVALSAGPGTPCAIREDQSIACWGDAGSPSPPRGKFRAVSAVSDHACAVRVDGRIACWGEGAGRPPKGRYVDVRVGFDFSCALTTGGAVRCWGWDDESVPTLPPGPYRSMALDGWTVCGRRDDGTVTCEGEESGSAGLWTFTALSGSGLCGIRTGGSLACWGEVDEDEEGEWSDVETPAAPDLPDGEFTTVSGSPSGGCAVRVDGQLVCWPSNAATSAEPATTVGLDVVVPRTASSKLDVRWTANAPLRPVVSYDVRYRRIENGGGWTAWRNGVRATHARIAVRTPKPGDEYSIQVRARDADGRLSDWSEAWATLPVDDRALARGSGWARVSSGAYYRSSALRSTRSGARLTLKDFGTLALWLVATTCPTCGTVKVSVIRRSPGEDEDGVSPPEPVTVSLRSSTRHDRRLVFVMENDQSLYGDLRIEVVSAGRPVIIDGLLLRDY